MTGAPGFDAPGSDASGADASDADLTSARPVLRIVRGNPTPEDVATLTALMLAASGEPAAEPRELRGGWRDPARQFRRPPIPGPNAWRSSGW